MKNKYLDTEPGETQSTCQFPFVENASLSYEQLKNKNMNLIKYAKSLKTHPENKEYFENDHCTDLNQHQKDRNQLLMARSGEL